MRRSAMSTVFAGLAWLTCVSRADDLAKQLVASTLIAGSVQIAPDGKVKDYSIDQMSKLPPAVQSMLQETIARWRFERGTHLPVDIKERMTLRLVAKPVDDVRQAISVATVTFSDDFGALNEAPLPLKRPVPRYPDMAKDARIGGTVYLLALVGKDGKVWKVFTEQVNLRALLTTKDQERFRKNLSDAATQAVASWTWTHPVSGRLSDKPGYWVRIPFNFTIQEAGRPPNKAPAYGDWDIYSGPPPHVARR